MRLGIRFLSFTVAAAVATALFAPAAGAQTSVPSAAPVQQLRIVGGLASVKQYKLHEEPFWLRTVPQITGGRVGATIVPFDQAGLPAQDLLRLVQVGVVPFGTALMSRVAAQDAELGTADLPGLNLDAASLRRNLGSFRPHLERMLRERYGVELLAVYVYPAQVTFCNKPFKGLIDLKGRRVRVASGAQADLVKALGALPVQTEFSEIVNAAKSGTIDCAITGAMSGNTIGLHEHMSHIDASAVTWGLSMFVANPAAWDAVAPAQRAQILQGLARLEQAIWDESAADTANGVACNTGAPSCVDGRRGRMTAVPALPEDEQRLREVLRSHVLPAWLQRCGPSCAPVWNQTLRAGTGIELPAR